MYIGGRQFLNSLLVVRREFPDKDAKLVDSLIHAEKIGLRNAYRLKEKNRDKWDWHGDWDSRWGKVVIPFEMTKEEEEEFRENNTVRWHNPYDDGRDCTGVWFTNYISFFRVNGKTIIYHFMSCDV